MHIYIYTYMYMCIRKPLMYTHCMNVFEHFPLQAHFSVDSTVYSTKKNRVFWSRLECVVPTSLSFPVSLVSQTLLVSLDMYLHIYVYTWNQVDVSFSRQSSVVPVSLLARPLSRRIWRPRRCRCRWFRRCRRWWSGVDVEASIDSAAPPFRLLSVSFGKRCFFCQKHSHTSSHCIPPTRHCSNLPIVFQMHLRLFVLGRS